MWARIHKIDRLRPQPAGGATVLIEDERSSAAMGRIPPISTLVAIARVLNARKALALKYAGKGDIRYAAAASPPPFLVDAVIRAGASVCDSSGENVRVPPAPAALASVVDTAFAELAHHVRTSIGVPDMATALQRAEAAARKKAPLDRDANPAVYWTTILELMALAGELSRTKGGRWVEHDEMPLPFALRFPKGEVAHPARRAQQLVDGVDPDAPGA